MKSGDLIQQASRLSHAAREKQLAVKLLDHIQSLHDNYEDSRKRWVWELIQNAYDASSVAGIEIEIEVRETEVRFKHNGSPFALEQLMFLIEQTSTKDRYKAPGASADYGGGRSAGSP